MTSSSEAAIFRLGPALSRLLLGAIIAIILARLSLPSYASDSLLWPLSLHLFAIAIFFIFFYRWRKRRQDLPRLKTWWLLPGAAVWLFAVLSWQRSAGSTAIPLNIEILATITIVPIAEELYFRAGASELWRRAFGPVAGSIASALYFAVLHGSGDIFTANILTWLPIGPFLLALCCEILYRKTQRIRVACYFHLSCNLSAVLFYQGMPFEFLHYFYL